MSLHKEITFFNAYIDYPVFFFWQFKKNRHFWAQLSLETKIMEDLKKKNATDMNDREIVFSQSIKAGKRIYYLDVKKNRKDEMFLAITESKKIVMGEGDDSQVSFEKHKIFLYKEDFEKFMNGLQQAVGFIQEQQGSCPEYSDNEVSDYTKETKTGLEEERISSLDGEIKIDIDF